MTRDELKLLDEYLSARRRVIEDYRGAAIAVDTVLAAPEHFSAEQRADRMEFMRRMKSLYEAEFPPKAPVSPPLPPAGTLTPDEEDALVRVERGGGIFGPKRKHLNAVCGALRRLAGLTAP
jgi:hypothetical protein